ncbi:hypothetical protein DSO57_1028930 [Entomophthora muscae]|uniref:Uncharacterized protein n=1 Tax=Entomophthora muscae TaxID=34485 RepID=A0ACC2UB23_9FUNG|nr:hypothetical protein DSO57_1028930 [Entomophthora muscae]
MNPPLTPRPDRPLEPTAAEKTTSTQLFGVLYITLTGLVDSMVPNSGPGSLLGQSHPFYGGPYPPTWLCLTLSCPTPPPMTGFLTQINLHPTPRNSKAELIAWISLFTTAPCTVGPGNLTSAEKLDFHSGNSQPEARGLTVHLVQS